MKTVLLIDDDQSSRLVVSKALKKAGWDVIEADDGEVGLSLVVERKPDAIVCDLLMPRCNGFQVCRILRERPDELSKTKIIIITSSGYATDRLNAFEAGADAYFIKPFVTADLIESLTHLLSPEKAETVAKNGKTPATTTGGSKPPPPTVTRSTDHPVSIKFWGVRGSIPTPGPGTAFYGGNTSCVSVKADGEMFILDAGTGIRPLGLQMLAEAKGEPMAFTVLITHTHWDHIQGFPFFVPAYNPKNSITILGYEGARRGLENTLSSQMESPYFPISMQQMPGNINIQELKDLKFNVGKVGVQTQFMNHPGICVGYRLNTSAGSVTYIPDNEPFMRMKSLGNGQQPDKTTLEFARKKDNQLIEFIKDTDVLIMDSQYDAMEYPRHVGWGHTCVDDSVAIALAANVRRLYLFHHDPGHDDTHISHMVAWARKVVARKEGNLIVEAAREGLEYVLTPTPKSELTVKDAY